MSVDPSSVSIDKTNPQSWNRYTYTYNNPLAFVDHNGKWPTTIHDQIIDKAFPGLSPRQRQVLKDASSYVDGGQTRAHNHDHAMKSRGEDPAAANAAIDQIIKSREEAVKTNGGPIPGKVDQLNDIHLYNFGAALHTVEDRTSPAHTDENGNPRDWDGLPTSTADIDKIEQHRQEEANITPDQLNAAVDAAHRAFTDTFGPDLEKQAEQPPKKDEPNGEASPAVTVNR